LATSNNDFKVKKGLQVAEGGTFGAPVSVGSPTGPDHATTKNYVDSIILVTGPAGNYIVSVTPPATPVDGDAWFNSEAGSMFVYYDSFWIEVSGAAGESGILPTIELSFDSLLASGNRYFVDTSIPRTLTLPADPIIGDEIKIFDATGLCGTNNIAILNNSLKINGILDSALLDIDGVEASFTYTGLTYGWKLS